MKNKKLFRTINRKAEEGMMITDEFLRRMIDQTIEFDKKMEDPEFIKKMEIEMEKIRNVDLSQYFKDDNQE